MANRNFKLFVSFLVLVVATRDVSVARDTKGFQHEQTFFTSDSPDEVYIRKPIILRDEAINTLKGSETGMDCLERQHQLDAAWVVGSEVHLGDAGETDIVVMPRFFHESPPRNWCVLGPNTTTYWVLRKRDKEYQLLLETKASALSIEKPRHNGYVIIKTYINNYSETVTVFYRMDNGRYQEYKRKLTNR